MESFILAVSLLAAAGSTLVLLACLAGKRAEMIQVFTVQQEREARRRALEAEHAAKAPQHHQTTPAQPLQA